MTCWRRLRDWYQAGVWRRLHQEPLEELVQADHIDWDGVALDSAAVPAWGQETGKNPTSTMRCHRAGPVGIAEYLRDVQGGEFLPGAFVAGAA